MQITKVSQSGFYGLNSIKPSRAKQAAKRIAEPELDFNKYAYATPTGEIAKETSIAPQKASTSNYYPFGNPTNKEAAQGSDYDKVDLNDKSHDFLSVSMMLGKQ